MADMKKENAEESMDDGLFSMYSDWIENGYADAGETGASRGQEQKAAATPENQKEGEKAASQGQKAAATPENQKEVKKAAAIPENQKEGEKAASQEQEKQPSGGRSRKRAVTPENQKEVKKAVAIPENQKEGEKAVSQGQEKQSSKGRSRKRAATPENQKEGETAASQEQGQKESRNPFDTLLKIVEKNAPEEAAALKEVQQYIEEMNGNYKSMCSELEELKKQLAERSDSSGLGRQAVENLEKNADGLKVHQEGFLKKLFQKAAQVIRNFGAKGVIALNNIVQKLGIKESLQEERKYYLDNAAKMQKSVDKLDAINSEIYAAANHIKNIGRLATGNELQRPQDRENIIIKILKRPYVQNRDMYQEMAAKTEGKIKRLEHLEQKAVQARSTVAKLSDYKKEAASRNENQKDSQDRGNIRKEPEMAL